MCNCRCCVDCITQEEIIFETYIGSFKFNEWVEVKIQLNTATDYTWIHVNLDSGLNDALLGDEAVNIYFDNFSLEEPKWGVIY